MKGGKKPESAFGKTEHGQLLVSVEWFKQQYSTRRCFRVVLHPNNRATEPAMAESTLALTFDKLSQLVSEIRALLTTLCQSTVTKGLAHSCVATC